jgi:hypothetical protein
MNRFGRNPIPEPDTIDHGFGRQPARTAAPEMLQPHDLRKLVLPSRDVADELLVCYWNTAYPVFPLLHKPTFMATYEKLWTGSGSVEGEHGGSQQILFNVALNLVFAIACQFTTVVPPEERSTYGAEFYLRSRMINNVELLDGVELQIVQIMLLQAIYLYWNQQRYTDRCWNVLGAAIRAAQGLGLHLNRPTRKHPSELEREMRRRIWHCLTTLDRFLSIYYGRPIMVPKRFNKVDLPALIDDEELGLDQAIRARSVDRPRQIGLFIYTIHLFDILEDILEAFYHDTDEMSPDDRQLLAEWPQILHRLVELEHRLEEYRTSLPRLYKIYDFPGSRHEAEDVSLLLQTRVLRNR